MVFFKRLAAVALLWMSTGMHVAAESGPESLLPSCETCGLYECDEPCLWCGSCICDGDVRYCDWWLNERGCDNYCVNDHQDCSGPDCAGDCMGNYCGDCNCSCDPSTHSGDACPGDCVRIMCNSCSYCGCSCDPSSHDYGSDHTCSTCGDETTCQASRLSCQESCVCGEQGKKHKDDDDNGFCELCDKKATCPECDAHPCVCICEGCGGAGEDCDCERCDICGSKKCDGTSCEELRREREDYEAWKEQQLEAGWPAACIPDFNTWKLLRESSKDPINIVTGELYFTESDISVPAPGIPLVFERFYGSEKGWRHSYQWTLESHIPALFGQGVFKVGAYGFISTSYEGGIWSDSVIKPDPADILLTTGEGMDIEFNESKTEPGVFYPKALDWKIVREEVVGGGYRFVLHQPAGVQYVFNGLELECIRDAWGNRIDFTYASNAVHLAHSCGATLLLEHGGDSNRIDRAYVSDGLFVEYGYDAASNLTSAVRHVSGETFVFSYAYEDGKMVSKTNPRQDEFRFSHDSRSSGDSWDDEDEYGYYAGACDDNTRTTTLEIGDGWMKHKVEACWGYSWDAMADFTTGAMENNEEEYRHSTVTYDYEGGLEKKFRYDTDGGMVRRQYGPYTGNAIDRSTGVSYTHEGKNPLTEKRFDTNTCSSLTLHKRYDEQSHVTAMGVSFNSDEPVWQTHAAYDPQWQLPVAVTNAEGHWTATTYTNGRPLVVKAFWSDTESFDTHHAYYPNSLLAAVTNPNQHTTTLDYDANGNLSLLTPPTGPRIATLHNALGHMERSEILAENGVSTGRITEYDVNAKGWVKSITHPDGLCESFAYDNAGNVTNATDRAGRATDFAYAPTQKLLSSTRYLCEGESNVPVRISYDFDKMFNTLSITEPRYRYVESYQLDLQDRVVAVTNIENQVMGIEYYVGDMIAKTTRFDGSTVSNGYDQAGRLSYVQYGNASVPLAAIAYEYYPDGELKTVSDAYSSITNSYDRLNRLTNSVASLALRSFVANHQFNPAGNVTNTVVSSTDSADYVDLSYVYDAAERLGSLATKDRKGTQRFVYAYNPENGLVASISNTVSGLVCTYAYDLMDRATSITYRAGNGSLIRALEYEYDAVSMITEKKIVDGASGSVRHAYGYDSLDRLVHESVTATSAPPRGISYAYDLAGNRLSKVSNGVATTYALGIGNRLESSETTALTNSLFVSGQASEPIGTDNRWGSLSVSNLTSGASVVPSVNGNSFFANIPAVSGSTNTIIAAIRDRAGNMGYATNAVFVPSTDFTDGEDCSYAYDAAGCLTNIVQGTNSIVLEWDERYRLKWFVVPPSGGSVEYGYDVLGRKVSRSEIPPEGGSTNVEHYVYDGNQVVADLDGSGNMLRTYVWGSGIDNLLCFTDHTTSNTYYPIKDHQNTVLALVDETDAVVESYEYSAYGEILDVKDGSGNPISDQQSVIGSRYLFQGREYDCATGFYYFRARWYDPSSERWLSKDPIGISGGLNLYAFCDNNPVNFMDPLGLFRFGDRPLFGAPNWTQYLGGSLSTHQTAHEHGFFEDGSGMNVGYFGPSRGQQGGVRFAHNSKAENPGNYTLSRLRYDDNIMKEAIKNVNSTDRFTSERYGFVRNNCRDYAMALKKEYLRLGGKIEFAHDGLRNVRDGLRNGKKE